MGRLVDHYEVLGEIARGGAGTVFRARDSRSGAPVALKLLHKIGRADYQLRRLRREVANAGPDERLRNILERAEAHLADVRARIEKALSAIYVVGR